MLLIQDIPVAHANVFGQSSSCRTTGGAGKEQNNSVNELKIYPKTSSLDMDRNAVQVKLIYDK